MSAADRQPFIARAHLLALAFFAVLVFLVIQAGRMIAPFSTALLWAAILALAVHPLYRRLLRRLKGRAGLAAGLMTLFVSLFVIGPALALLTLLATQAAGLYQWAAASVQSGSLADTWTRVNALLHRLLESHPSLAAIDAKGIIMKAVGQLSSGLAGALGTVLKHTLLIGVDLAVALVALFFLFRDGETYYRTLADMAPLDAALKRTIAAKLHDTFYAVINGVFLIALGQGVMTGIGFALFGVPFAVFWGFAAALLALLPIGGAALVWVPGAIWLFLAGTNGAGIGLAIWGLALVSLPDNFLKPLLIGKKAQIPSFFLFLGILGGLSVYGVFGILFGPVVVTLLTAFLRIYREEYAER